jgi:hypothetical protein
MPGHYSGTVPANKATGMGPECMQGGVLSRNNPVRHCCRTGLAPDLGSLATRAHPCASQASPYVMWSL